MKVKIGKKVFRASVAVALLCALLSGCRRENEEQPVEITFINGWGGTLKTHNTMLALYHEFAGENPQINLKGTPYSDSRIAVKKANDMLAVGKMPDIVSTNGLSYYVSNAVKRNMAMDLMPYIEADEELKNAIHPSVFETWTTNDGCLYTVPDALEMAGYWYNESYFQQAGIKEIPKNWEQFREVVSKLEQWITDSGTEISVCSLDQVQLSENLFLARLAGENENGLQSAKDSSVLLETQTIARTMEDIAALNSTSSRADNIENARQNFSDGKCAMYFNGVWESDTLSDSKNSGVFRYAPYPSNNGQSLAYISPSSGYVFARQKDEEKAKACIAFLKYMLSEKVQKKMAVQTGQAPANPEVNSFDVEKENPILGNAIRSVYDADIQIKTIWSVWTEEKIQVVQTYCEQVLQGKWEETKSEEMRESLNHK